MRGFSRMGMLAMLSGVGSIASGLAALGPGIAAPTVPAWKTGRRYSGYVSPRTTTYFPAGLNGKRAVARRLRQIERGSLRVENGLVRLPDVRKLAMSSAYGSHNGSVR